ncbi:TonB family protein [Yersinia intermedia]|uniref:TonB family protein n=1 Tax=Yersinia intermedia TaxID=631 RepID=UPI0005EA47F0|nr:TonB family protein [Yersinia intermedia]MCB5325037.1 TonB family protein [Yersinia intermedia]CNE44292.1 TonB-related phage protein [Yersinia intermedia]CNH55185.1 TonB-related phage protein [Yersinia intermedia]CNK19330.1 TonB-related phage protein [Yersinia intermedia]
MKNKVKVSFLVLYFSSLYQITANANDLTSNNQPPKLMERNIEIYPSRAWVHDKEGYVKIAYDIDSSGKVKNAKIVESEPKSLFDKAALDSIYKWRYEANNPVDGMVVTINFKKPH